MKNLVIQLLIIFLFVITFSSHAQNVIKGSVIDQSNESKVGYATVALLNEASAVISGTMTDNDGNFSLEYTIEGTYVLKASFLGYQTKEVRITTPTTTDSVTINLSPNETLLNEVVITGQRPLIVQRTDRFIVNVAEHISTGGKNSLEVLAQTPGVMLIGSEINAMGKPAVIYIDGRPTQLSGEQLASVLTSLKGDEIASIEIITNPSSRYDASGSAIIDIKTKKGLQYGFNGSVDAGYRQSRKDRENVGLSMNYRQEKLNIYGNYGAERSNKWQQVQQSNTMNVENVSYLFDQQTLFEANQAQYTQNYKIGVDYFVNPNHTIGALFNGGDAGNAFNVNINGETTITPALDNVRYSTSQSTQSAGYNSKQYNLNYLGLFSKPGQQLNIDLDYARFSSDKGQRIANMYWNTDSLQIENTELMRNQNPQNIQIWSAKADFTQPIAKGKLEFGIKYAQSNTDNNLNTETFENAIWANDNDVSNHFVYTEQIQAAYVNYSQSFGKWDLQAGLRGEYTRSKGDQKTTNSVNDTIYMNWFPTLFVNYRISQVQTLNASYRKSIFRPSYQTLNPFETRFDAYSFEKGNPYLKPMMMDNFSLSYNNHKLGLMAMFAYGIRHNQITEVPIQEGEQYGLTKTNFGKYQQANATINYSRNITQWWMLNAMIMGQYGLSYNNSEEFGLMDEHLFSGYGQIYNRFNIQPTLAAELTALYASSQQQGYLKVEPMYSVNIGLRKMFLNNKMAVSLNVNDIFDTFRLKAVIHTQSQQYALNINRDNRYVSLNVKYTFGSDKVKSSRKKSHGVEEEMGRTVK